MFLKGNCCGKACPLLPNSSIQLNLLHNHEHLYLDWKKKGLLVIVLYICLQRLLLILFTLFKKGVLIHFVSFFGFVCCLVLGSANNDYLGSWDMAGLMKSVSSLGNRDLTESSFELRVLQEPFPDENENRNPALFFVRKMQTWSRISFPVYATSKPN